MGIVSLVIAFSMLQKNYRTAATFITLSVIFIYAIIRPDVLNVIQYRILDTLIGAALSFIGIWLLWPVWSFRDIKGALEKSVSANQNFLTQIIRFYEKKDVVSLDYEVSRKQAFTETSNLSAAFQSMVQEPESKQRNVDEVYELTVLNHHLLSSLASLSSYIKQHPTTDASENFLWATARIDDTLNKVLVALKQPETNTHMVSSEKKQEFENELPELTENISEFPISEDQRSERNFQEIHLLREQLTWLFSLSQKMLRVVAKIELDGPKFTK